MRLQFVPVICSVLMLAVAGCKSAPPPVPTETSAPVDTAPPARTEPAPSQPAIDPEAQALRELQSAGTVIYFDYDRAEIKPEFVPVVTAHAKYLNGNSARKARLEGHSDERGSREYNIGLGERRSQAVRRALLLQGVAESQITTVSYGEEMPAVSGSDEAAYSRNRRVQMAYGAATR
jgi:peptidoglycan-associated lipoprotein